MARKATPEQLERDRLLRRALLLPARPLLGEFRLRPFSLWTLDLCEEIGLGFFLELPEGTKPAGSRIFQLATLVWCHDATRSIEEVDDALAAGTWRDEARRLARDPRLERSLDAIADYVAFFSRLIAAASVRVKRKPRRRGEKEEVDPPDLLEPATPLALCWSISGGSIEGPDRFREIYRETPLPVVLGFYHCALRAALVWTVPARRGRKDAAKVVSREAVASALATVLEKSKAKGGADFF